LSSLFFIFFSIKNNKIDVKKPIRPRIKNKNDDFLKPELADSLV